MITTVIDLRRNVVEQLAFDPSIDQSDIAVAIGGDGVVTLTGSVPTYAQKLATERAVKRVRGVHGIAEELTIELPPFHRRNDTEIVHSALTALRWNTNVPTDSVLVKVQDGWVTLTGTVNWQYQREAARLAISTLSSVRGVSNDIVLRQVIVAGDVASKIRDSFRRYADVDASKIEIETSDDVVTLRGTVHSWTERDEATSAAYSNPGVSDVNNLVTISD